MKVINEVEVYELDGEDTQAINKSTIQILNHWNMTDRVIIKIDDTEYTVIRRDIEKAIDNACNHR